MPSGGRRPGAGRKKGTVTAKTLERRRLAKLAADSGITPQEVMLGTMRALWNRALQPGGKIDIDLAKDAHNIAKDVAPYVHPKLQSIIGDPEKPIVHEHRIGTMDAARRVAIVLFSAGTGVPLPAGRVIEAGKTLTQPST